MLVRLSLFFEILSGLVWAQNKASFPLHGFQAPPWTGVNSLHGLSLQSTPAETRLSSQQALLLCDCLSGNISSAWGTRALFPCPTQVPLSPETFPDNSTRGNFCIPLQALLHLWGTEREAVYCSREKAGLWAGRLGLSLITATSQAAWANLL